MKIKNIDEKFFELRNDKLIFSSRVTVHLGINTIRQSLRNAKRLSQHSRSLKIRKNREYLRDMLGSGISSGRVILELAKISGDLDDGKTATELLALCGFSKGNSKKLLSQAHGLFERNAGNYDKARKLFSAALSQDNYYAEVYHAWAEMESDLGDHQNAQKLYSEGLCAAQDKNNYKAINYFYSSIARLYQKMGKLEETRSWVCKGLESPKGGLNYVLWFQWALIEAKTAKEPIHCRYLLGRVLETNPKDRYAHHAAGNYECSLGNLMAARILFERGITLNPCDVFLLQTYAIFECNHFRNIRKARSLFRRATRLNWDDPKIWQAWAIAEWKYGNRIDRARDLFEAAFQKSKPSVAWADVFRVWSVMELEMGNISVARELLKWSLKINRSNQGAWYSWISMEEQIGNLSMVNKLKRIMMEDYTRVNINILG